MTKYDEVKTWFGETLGVVGIDPDDAEAALAGAEVSGPLLAVADTLHVLEADKKVSK